MKKFAFMAVIVAAAIFMWGTMAQNKPDNGAVASEQHTNRLAESFSPYLRQHMHNPVDWYEWGPEALKKAKVEDKPILVSIGYSTCYWCHVLERETFEHEDAAAIMNEHFVPIKVDREVRPDVDEIYMTATQLLTGRGGWPNNVFLTPDLKPFYAVTYLPKDRWMDMTRQIGTAWKSERRQMEAQAGQMEIAIKKYMVGTEPVQASLPTQNLAQTVYGTKAMSYDSRYGGFGAGTKFPQETGLLFLLSHAKTKDGTQALNMVQNTVDHMLAGGIHDHVGGGFHRYSTEAKWRIPHFEKMLYNQALMAAVLAQLFEETGEARYKRALVRLLDYVSRDMTDAGGAFYSAQDAETDAVEGAYYVWNDAELNDILGPEDYKVLTSIYAAEEAPHFPGHKHPDGEILYRAKDAPDETAQKRLDNVFAKLLSMRQKREAPLRDDKILTAWNGMMIYGLSEAARVLDDPAYVERAEKAAQFILANMKQDNGKLYRISKDGQPHQNAFLEDYAWLARGLMALHRVTGKEKYKTDTLELIATADTYFLDKANGGYYMTDGSDGLFVRIKAGDDSGALPSGNPVMAHVFADLYAATNDREWKNRMAGMTSAFAKGITDQPYIYGHMIHAMSRMDGPETAWLDTVEAAETAQAADNPPSMESKDKVNVRAAIEHDGSTETRKTVRITLEMEEGWHINANPASLDFLIPTVVDIQTKQKSILNVTYPEGHKMKTPLGTIDTYEGTMEITATVESGEPIDVSKIRALVQVQACQGATCYPPSQIAVNIDNHHGC